jgi:hypothetical protein
MKPVQQVLSLGIQIQLHVAYVLAAVGEEIDLLVGLHALGLKQLEQATFGLFIVGLNPGKARSRELLCRRWYPDFHPQGQAKKAA